MTTQKERSDLYQTVSDALKCYDKGGNVDISKFAKVLSQLQCLLEAEAAVSAEEDSASSGVYRACSCKADMQAKHAMSNFKAATANITSRHNKPVLLYTQRCCFVLRTTTLMQVV